MQQLIDWDYSQIWYHGSPLRLTTLRVGSTITQDRDLARIFSHKPSMVVQDTDACGKRIIKHTGTQSGFLYRIVDQVQPEDVTPHPATTMGVGQEWLTVHELRVALIEPTALVADEILTAEEIATLSTKEA
jgi:hypothetical protein